MSNIEDVLGHMKENTYTFKVPLLSNKNEIIEFRPLKTKDQKILSVEGDEANSEFQNFILLIKLLDACIVKNKVLLGDILLEDFFWLIINLRIKSLGATVELFGTCNHCGQKKNPFVINLEKDVEIKYLEGIKKNVFPISDKLSFFLKHVRLDDMIDILKEKEETGFAGLELSLASMIDYIEFNEEIVDVEGIENKLRLLEELTTDNLKKFKEFIEENSFGLTIKKTFSCSNKECGKGNDIELDGFDIIDFF